MGGYCILDLSKYWSDESAAYMPERKKMVLENQTDNRKRRLIRLGGTTMATLSSAKAEVK